MTCPSCNGTGRVTLFTSSEPCPECGGRVVGVDAASGDDKTRMIDPLRLAEVLWPDVYFYSKQRQAIYSVFESKETIAFAANMVGKDFVAGAIALLFFLIHRKLGHTCRVVTTSVKDDHLRVLWGEINRFIQTSRAPLTADKGGPLQVNHRDIRWVHPSSPCAISYLRGMVSESGEGLSGHHADATLFICDEASGIKDEAYVAGQGWMKHMLAIGNPNDCQNFFRRAVKGGDIVDPESGKVLRRIIQIRAEDSPNVEYALAQKALGIEPTNEVLVPGVLSYSEYCYRRLTWDVIRQTVGLDAEFYEGAENLLFPPMWLNAAHDLADRLRRDRISRTPRSIGVDPAEGGDSTAMAVVDEYGLIELVSVKTPNTNAIPGMVRAFAQKHGVPMSKVFFDRGGGGKQHVDRMRADGDQVQTVAFGEVLLLDLRRGMTMFDEKKEVREAKYVYKNRRAEMYGSLSDLLDPAGERGGFALPREYTELRRQLAPIPRWYDEEGRMYLPPKNNKGGDKDSDKVTMTRLIGCSPDEADAVVLACYGMRHKLTRPKVGAMV